MTKILVDVDERDLARAAARLGTASKKDTIGHALELAAEETPREAETLREWEAWADSLGERVSQVDWEQAWR